MSFIPHAAPRTITMFGCGVALLLSSSCRKPKPVAGADKPPVEIASELMSNGLIDSPSTPTADQSPSPVHWQPFNQLTLDRAKKADRLIFGVVILPQQPDYLTVLKSINDDPLMVKMLNDQFVPVLIDADACREIGLLSSVLCAEASRPLGLPLFLWMTPQGNPVTWIPVNSNAKGLRDLFNQSSMMVAQTWKEDSNYVINNSANDNRSRTERLLALAKCPPGSKQAAADTAVSLRRLASLYDSGARSFDGCGALFPSGAIDLLASSLFIQSLPADITVVCRATSRSLSEDLISSAMIDPLDGGIFNSRIGSGWSLPRFSRDCQSQARATVALINAHRSSGKRELLDAALASIAHAEKHFSTQGGLFSLGRHGTSPMESWLWSTEELEKLLTPDEAKVMVAVSELKGLGNIPVESDPQREYFRRNSLAIRNSPEATAPKLGLNPAAARDYFESARKKLLKVRQERLGSVANDPRPHAASTFRMVSAYAAAYTATGEPEWRKKAIETLQRARETFSRGPSLQNFPGPPDVVNSGRAFLYGLAMQAALDVADITLDPNLVSWTEDLASTASERFMEGDVLRETAKGQSLIDLPLTDRSMLFDDSTAGLFSSAQARLAQLGRHTPEAFTLSVVPFPQSNLERPLLHTDQLLASLIREYAPIVLLSRSASPALKDAVSRLPLRVIARRTAQEPDAVPPSSAKIVFKDGHSMATSDSAALLKAFATDGANR